MHGGVLDSIHKPVQLGHSRSLLPSTGCEGEQARMHLGVRRAALSRSLARSLYLHLFTHL